MSGQGAIRWFAIVAGLGLGAWQLSEGWDAFAWALARVQWAFGLLWFLGHFVTLPLSLLAIKWPRVPAWLLLGNGLAVFLAVLFIPSPAATSYYASVAALPQIFVGLLFIASIQSEAGKK